MRAAPRGSRAARAAAPRRPATRRPRGRCRCARSSAPARGRRRAARPPAARARAAASKANSSRPARARARRSVGLVALARSPAGSGTSARTSPSPSQHALRSGAGRSSSGSARRRRAGRRSRTASASRSWSRPACTGRARSPRRAASSTSSSRPSRRLHPAASSSAIDRVERRQPALVPLARAAPRTCRPPPARARRARGAASRHVATGSSEARGRVPGHAGHLEPVLLAAVEDRAAEVEGERRRRRPAPPRSSAWSPARGRRCTAPRGRTRSDPVKLGTSTSLLRPEHAARGVAPALGLAEHVEQALARGLVVRPLDRLDLDLGGERDRVDLAAGALAHRACGSASVGAAACGTATASRTPKLGLGDRTARSRARRSSSKKPSTASLDPRPAGDALPVRLDRARRAGRPRRWARSRAVRRRQPVDDQHLRLGLAARRASRVRGTQLVPDLQVELRLGRARRGSGRSATMPSPVRRKKARPIGIRKRAQSSSGSVESVEPHHARAGRAVLRRRPSAAPSSSRTRTRCCARRAGAGGGGPRASRCRRGRSSPRSARAPPASPASGAAGGRRSPRRPDPVGGSRRQRHPRAGAASASSGTGLELEPLAVERAAGARQVVTRARRTGQASTPSGSSAPASDAPQAAQASR